MVLYPDLNTNTSSRRSESKPDLLNGSRKDGLLTPQNGGRVLLKCVEIDRYGCTESANENTKKHIAVMHRHKSIYNLLYEIGDLTPSLEDLSGNNMLHLGVSLLMQHELQWYKEVENISSSLVFLCMKH